MAAWVAGSVMVFASSDSTSQIGDIQRARFSDATRGVNFRRDFFQMLSAARTEHYGMPFAGEMTGGGFANATARAGDENYFGFNVCFHI